MKYIVFIFLFIEMLLCGCDSENINSETSKDLQKQVELSSFNFKLSSIKQNKKGEFIIFYLSKMDKNLTLPLCFRKIKPNNFIMGDDNLNLLKIKDAPRHQVFLTKEYWMATTECTQILWSYIMERNPSQFTDYRAAFQAEALFRPVEMVSWNDCQEFLVKLNQIVEFYEIPFRFRLPTEAEWEYACQSGEIDSKTKLPKLYGFPYEVENEQGEKVIQYLGDYARFIVNSSPKENGKMGSKRTWKVNERSSNAWGLFGMLGNVSEWCEDACYCDPFKGISQETYKDKIIDPIGKMGDAKIFRGGAWDSLKMECRNAHRRAMRPDYKNCNLGFRIVAYPYQKIVSTHSKSFTQKTN